MLAFAAESMGRSKRGWRHWLSNAARDFKRGFVEGYRDEVRRELRLPQRAAAR
jgi:hypothetical protein